MAQINEIKISRKNIGGYKTFGFKNGDYSFFPYRDTICPSCSRTSIDYLYKYIIDKLNKADLLPKDFKIECCDCSYINSKLGFTKCLKCNYNLYLINFSGIMTIKCYNCDKIYYPL